MARVVLPTPPFWLRKEIIMVSTMTGLWEPVKAPLNKPTFVASLLCPNVVYQQHPRSSGSHRPRGTVASPLPCRWIKPCPNVVPTNRLRAASDANLREPGEHSPSYRAEI